MFRNKFVEKEIVLQGIEKSISKVMNASLFRSKINPTILVWDSFIIQEWKSLLILWGSGISNNQHSKIDRPVVQWLPPKSGIVKLNFDGVSRGNLGKSSLGACVILPIAK